MNLITDIFKNEFLMVGGASWLLAQVLKAIIYAVINKKFSLKRLFGDGGMPSGHSAMVTSVAVIGALVYGTASFQFAICASLAVIVCHDAMGVRLETGKQAVIINELTRAFDVLMTNKHPEVKLKEFVGHTPIQVIAGALVGFGNAVMMHYLIFA